MKTYRSLWHVIMRTVGSVSSALRESSMGTARSRATRGILVLALLLGGLGAATLAMQAHGGAGHVHASAGKPADSRALPAGSDLMRSSVIARGLPWMW
jgi:hypothetical protein